MINAIFFGNVSNFHPEFLPSMSSRHCYCKKPKDWSTNLLQCCKCKHWFHEGCVQCLDMPLIAGDRFYIFVCTHCNGGDEYLARLELKWLELVHLVLYHLTLTHKEKYFDCNSCIIPFINDNWKKLQLTGKVSTAKPSERLKLVQKVLLSHTKKFSCGKEVKKKCSLWGLRVRLPPAIPPIVSVTPDTYQDVHSLGFKIRGRTFEVLSSKKRNNSEYSKSPLKGHSKLFTSSGMSRCEINISQLEESTREKSSVCKIRKGNVTFNDEDEIASYGILDSIIPFPQNFEGLNHPFQNLKFGLKSKHSQAKKSKLCNDLEISRNGNIQKYNQSIFQESCKRKWVSDPENCEDFNSNRKIIALNYHIQNGEIVTTNGYQSDFSFDPEDLPISQFFQSTKNISRERRLRIVGKRVTTQGSIQYLVERDK